MLWFIFRMRTAAWRFVRTSSGRWWWCCLVWSRVACRSTSRQRSSACWPHLAGRQILLSVYGTLWRLLRSEQYTPSSLQYNMINESTFNFVKRNPLHIVLKHQLLCVFCVFALTSLHLLCFRFLRQLGAVHLKEEYRWRVLSVSFLVPPVVQF